MEVTACVCTSLKEVSLFVNPNYDSRFLIILLKEKVKTIVFSNNNKEIGKNNDSKMIYKTKFPLQNQGGLNRKEIQPNLCNIFFIFIFNTLYLFA